MIDLKKYRVVDLSKELRPGVRKVNGEYVHGEEMRRLEIRQFIYMPDKMLMHWVDTESHIGTHVEGPSHYPGQEKAPSDLPLEAYMGEALVQNLTSLKPEGGKGQPITPSHLEKVKRGDIVLLWSPYSRAEAPYISSGAAEWLRERGVKMLGIQGVGLEAPGSTASHDAFLKNGIPIIEGLVNLDKLRRERVFYIGLPIKMAHIDSTWIRAIALEEI